jgi:hypothetical protein
VESVVIDAFAAEPGGTFSAIMSLSTIIGLERKPLQFTKGTLKKESVGLLEALERRFALFACGASRT